MRSRLFFRASNTLSTTSARLYSSMAREILKDFHEVQASYISDNLLGTLATDKRAYKLHHYTWRINITLDSPANLADVPQHPVFTPEYEREHNAKRHPETSIFSRGDNRSIDEIRAAGKIKPKGEDTNPIEFYGYDLTQHRKNSKFSYFVSATKKMVVAHTFGQTLYGEGKYTVYLMKAKDTMGPHLRSDAGKYESFIAEEEEHSILGGVKYEDIVGFRECTKISAALSFYCGNIYISKAFAKQHKKHVDALIEVQKFPEEVRLSWSKI